MRAEKGRVLRHAPVDPTATEQPADDPMVESAESRPRDEGAVLVLVLVFLIVGTLIVYPLMNFTITILKANTTLSDKARRVETVKSGLRVALSDPVSLYETCGAAGPTVPVNLASPTVNGQTLATKCYFVDFASAQSADEEHFGLVTTQANTSPPAPLKGASYVSPNPSDAARWISDATAAPTTNKIWLPNLPVHGLNRRAATGYQMPAGFPACTIFFPGTYADPVTLTGPTYFTSGVYYFENTVTVRGGASAVVGMGATQGCSDDQEAAFYAVNAPATHNINGLGATFVFGDAGRLLVDNSNNQPLSLNFNLRYTQPGDTGYAPSAAVSIMSVNGAVVAGNHADFDLPNVNRVPLSVVGATGASTAASQSYVPSTLTAATAVPAATGPTTAFTPIVSIQLPAAATAQIDVPGYVAVPQGLFAVSNPGGKDVKFEGGVLASNFLVSDARAGTPAAPQSVDIGFLQSVVQRTFRIVTTWGNSHSIAIVQVNQNGAYAVNSWEVQ